jgi:pimeloyl-ACP methyl ester carboxylesterase
MDEVVLVHGLWYRCWSMAWLKRRLQRAGYRVRCFGYPTLAQAPEQSARALADFCARSEANVVHLVGHSLGGLVILAMLGQGAYHPTGRLLLLGTPLAGSSVVRRIAAWPGGSRILGQAREFLAAGASATGA